MAVATGVIECCSLDRLVYSGMKSLLGNSMCMIGQARKHVWNGAFLVKIFFDAQAIFIPPPQDGVRHESSGTNQGHDPDHNLVGEGADDIMLEFLREADKLFTRVLHP